MEKKGGEGVHGGQSALEGKKEIWKLCGERTWTLRMRPRAVKNWMSKKMPNKLRDVERLSLISKEAQESVKESLQHQQQGVETRRHDLKPEHQKTKKTSQKIQSIQDKRRNLQKDSIAAEEEMRKLQEELRQKEERFLFLSNKVDKNKMADAAMAAELQSLQAEEERKGSNTSQTGDCCLEEMLRRVIVLGTNGVEVLFQRVRCEMGAAQGQMPGREGGRRSSEDEQEQGRISQQLVVPAPGGINEGTPASSLELDLPRLRVHLANAEEQENQVHWGIAREVYQNSPSRRPMEEGALAGDL